MGDRMLVAGNPVWGTNVCCCQRSAGGDEGVDKGGNLRSAWLVTIGGVDLVGYAG